jgi:hypothetical protein
VEALLGIWKINRIRETKSSAIKICMTDTYHHFLSSYGTMTEKSEDSAKEVKQVHWNVMHDC